MAEKVSNADLRAILDQCPRPGLYRHYKSPDPYQVIMVAISEATQQPLVVYQNQRSGIVFARPAEEWYELVEWDGQKVSRFTRW